MFRTYREFIGYSPFAMHDNLSMLAKVTGLSNEMILANGVLNCTERSELMRMIRKLNENYPIAYLLQSAYFCELPFYVNEKLLRRKDKKLCLYSSVVVLFAVLK